jgi:phosphoglycolate phosphatase
MMEAVVFDLDGTLLDTLEDLADSMNAVLASRGFPTHSSDAYRYFVGEGMETLVRRALPNDDLSDNLVRQCTKAMKAEYAVRWAVKTVVYSGIPELLHAVTSRGIPMAVLSNKPDEFTRLAVTELLKPWSFEPVCGARPDIPRKPDPTGARSIAATLGITPGHCLYLGDTRTDMETALGAGMFAVGATWGFRPRAELEAAGAQAVVDEPRDVLGLLDQDGVTERALP